MTRFFEFRFDPLLVSRCLGILTETIEASGLSPSVEVDFALLEQECEAFDGKTLSAQFSTRFFDLTPATGFWIAARDAAGVLRSVQAARLEVLDGISLAEHWAQQQRRIYCDPDPGGARLGVRHSPAASDITGRVVYHGDMYLDRNFRGSGVADALTRLGQIVAYSKWQPDFIYCFMSVGLVRRVFGAGQGYAHASPLGTHWEVAPQGIDPNDYLLWNTRRDLAHLVSVIAESVEAAPSCTPQNEIRPPS